jgi:SAM-dependent methyltransferase
MTESVRESLDALHEAIDRLTDPGPAVAAARGAGELRWSALSPHVNSQLAGKRVLDLGSGERYDALAFASRGAEYVLACTSSDALPRAEEGLDPPCVEFRSSGWQALDPSRDGTFDIVHCRGLLHRVLEPMSLLQTLRRVIAPTGSLLISSMMLGDPERSEFLRFVPDRHGGDPGCWFIPGRLAFRWMVETAGFEVEAEFGEVEGPRDGFPVAIGYLRAVCASRRSHQPE